jgi:hypothetical protein
MTDKIAIVRFPRRARITECFPLICAPAPITLLLCRPCGSRPSPAGRLRSRCGGVILGACRRLNSVSYFSGCVIFRPPFQGPRARKLEPIVRQMPMSARAIHSRGQDRLVGRSQPAARQLAACVEAVSVGVHQHQERSPANQIGYKGWEGPRGCILDVRFALRKDAGGGGRVPRGGFSGHDRRLSATDRHGSPHLRRGCSQLAGRRPVLVVALIAPPSRRGFGQAPS